MHRGIPFKRRSGVPHDLQANWKCKAACAVRASLQGRYLAPNQVFPKMRDQRRRLPWVVCKQAGARAELERRAAGRAHWLRRSCLLPLNVDQEVRASQIRPVSSGWLAWRTTRDTTKAGRGPPYPSTPPSLSLSDTRSHLSPPLSHQSNPLPPTRDQLGRVRLARCVAPSAWPFLWLSSCWEVRNEQLLAAARRRSCCVVDHFHYSLRTRTTAWSPSPDV